ncbi:sigma-70 family RNA polymerase sigma factor [Pilimelia columellifera]|uniref:RNA polymerase sigma factor n=1 Tax=Pilimelia columellifera TaxID=706574 RepID=UPI0031D827B1
MKAQDMEAPVDLADSQAEMLAAAAAGDAETWSLLIKTYSPMVQSLTFQYCLNRADAPDVTQTVWLRLWENASAIREPAALTSWIGRTTRNLCLRARRQDAYVRPVAPEHFIGVRQLQVGDPTEAVDDASAAAHRRRALRRALDDLGPRCRQLMALLMSESRPSYREIAAELDIPVGSIGPTRQRCLERLRQSVVHAMATQG